MVQVSPCTRLSGTSRAPEQRQSTDKKQPAPRDVTVKQAGGESGKSVALRKGQTLEIMLPSAYHWRLGTSNLGGTLTDVNQEGWYDATTQSCAWRFTGASAGTVPLDFGATPVCDPGKMCPALAFDVSYSVTVS